MRAESLEEETARRIVSQHLVWNVERFDDGRFSGMVDAIIRSDEGEYPLEVVADHEVAYRKQAAALQRYGHLIVEPRIRDAWHVTIERWARIDHLHQRLPTILLSLDDELPRRLDGDAVPTEIRDLGVRRLGRSSEQAAGWQIILSQHGWNGSAGTDELGEWVSRVLAGQPDVEVKLARHGGDQRHAFVWATIGSAFGAQHALMDEPRTPTAAPDLGPDITHVWVGGFMSTHGCVMWDPNSGWARTAWRW